MCGQIAQFFFNVAIALRVGPWRKQEDIFHSAGAVLDDRAQRLGQTHGVEMHPLGDRAQTFRPMEHRVERGHDS